MSAIKLFEEKKVRSVYIKQDEKWYFSVIDVIQILTDSSVPKRYWSDLKKKLTKEVSQTYDNIVRLTYFKHQHTLNKLSAPGFRGFTD